MKRSPWFPVWAGFQDDEQFLAISAEAELLYLRAVARCKQLDQGSDGGQIGRHQLRRLADKMVAAPADLAAELVEVGLWVVVDDGWQIVAYGDWNTSAAEDREGRSDAGKRGNHARWRHKGPFKSCPICHDPTKDTTTDVSPDESHRIRTAIAVRSQSESQRSRKPSLDRDRDGDGDGDDNNNSDRAQTDHQPWPTDVEAVAAADALIAHLGFVDPPPADAGERNYIKRAIARGWTIEQLTDLAIDAGSRDDVENPRKWFRGALKRCTNSDPPTDTTPTPNNGTHTNTGETKDQAWAQVAQLASSGVTRWHNPDLAPNLTPRTRRAAAAARERIRFGTSHEAKFAFFAAWDADHAPEETTTP